ncbi:hypothetical protein Tco_1346870 [Tanacetum coccineum]
MTTLADKSLLSGGDNKPPMLEKYLYDSWKSRIELYMMNRPHGRMILASIEKGPLVWPSITVDGVTRLKEYTELTPAEAIQADCNIKAINIILQGLPTEIYALVSQHRVAKDLWEKIKLLMQGTSLTKQEQECKMYDEFDKFTYKKGELLHEYYLRFTLLLNDMNIYKMPLEQFQVNTKFLNTLPDEWSKFVKLVKDLHTTNVDQLHAYLEQHERHANEVRLSVSTILNSSIINTSFIFLHGTLRILHSKEQVDAFWDTQRRLPSAYNYKWEWAHSRTAVLQTKENKGDDLMFSGESGAGTKLKAQWHTELIIYYNAALIKLMILEAYDSDLTNQLLPQLLSWRIYSLMINLENKSVNDTLTAELERYKKQVKVLKEGQNVDLRILKGKVLGSSVSFVTLLSFSTTDGGIGGPSYEAPLHVVISLASFLGFGMVLLGKELELEAWLV